MKTQYLCTKKCRLSKFEVSQSALSTFFQAAVQSVLLYCFLCCHSSLSAENMNKLERVVKQAAKFIHVTPLCSLHCHYMTKKTENTLRDAIHPLHTTFIPARSGICPFLHALPVTVDLLYHPPSGPLSRDCYVTECEVMLCSNYRTIYIYVLAGSNFLILCLH